MVAGGSLGSAVTQVRLAGWLRLLLQQQRLAQQHWLNQLFNC
jgi:hypothetical protein